MLRKIKKMQKKITEVVRYVNFAYTCRKFPNITMTKQTIAKKHIVKSLANLPQEVQDAVREKYPLGFTEAMMRIDKPNGDFFYAVPFETDDIAYMVKIDVKIDDQSHEDEDKDYYDDEIKGADEIQDDNSEADDDLAD